MGENTAIEWATHTFNPWEGCTKVSPACDNCYAEARNIRFADGENWGPKAPRRRTSESNWKKPLLWNKAAEKLGIRHRVFCASLADVFDNQVDPQWRADLWALIKATPNLDWLLLTKRPQNIRKMLPDDWSNGYANVWLGTSAENQEEYARRIGALLFIPAIVHFISAEPLLGALDLHRVKIPVSFNKDGRWILPATLKWVIAGGESGPNARPMHPSWARSLRDQCVDAKIPFFFKQWGEWSIHKCAPGGDEGGDMRRGLVKYVQFDREPDGHFRAGDAVMRRIGKGKTGRLLDGREWNEFPR